MIMHIYKPPYRAIFCQNPKTTRNIVKELNPSNIKVSYTVRPSFQWAYDPLIWPPCENPVMASTIKEKTAQLLQDL